MSVDLKYDVLCVLVSVCVRHTRLSRENNNWKFILVGGTALANPT